MIDVILPTYNHAHHVRVAVESILRQSFVDFTLTIVDDGSSDDTRRRLISYEKDDRVRIFTIEHSGLPAALNFGHSKGNSPYCTWISSDNVYHFRFLERVYEAAVASGADIVRADWVLVELDNRHVEIVSEAEVQPLGRFGAGSDFGVAFLYRRACWEEFKYDEDLLGAEDYKFFQECIKSGKSVLNIPDILATYYVQPGSLGTSLGGAEKVRLKRKANRSIGL
jgi:glycosyltransferase involved in cell wall biosynthesis